MLILTYINKYNQLNKANNVTLFFWITLNHQNLLYIDIYSLIYIFKKKKRIRPFLLFDKHKICQDILLPSRFWYFGLLPAKWWELLEHVQPRSVCTAGLSNEQVWFNERIKCECFFEWCWLYFYRQTKLTFLFFYFYTYIFYYIYFFNKNNYVVLILFYLVINVNKDLKQQVARKLWYSLKRKDREFSSVVGRSNILLGCLVKPLN